MYLPQNTVLHSRYMIETVLGHGGFGITYAAHDKLLNVRVAIKEYLPRQLATRGEGQTQVSIFTGEARQQYDYGLRKFLEEAQSVARFAHHPNVVSARDYFEANGTAYMVMEYVEGVTLKEYLAKKGGRISFEEAKGIMMPVMDALREVHQAGMLHRDVSPDNIYITTSAQVKILDFGAARYFAGEQSKSLSVILKQGYAPEEQYRSKGKQGPWTDVYATAATLYKAITGETPTEALDRVAEDTLTPPSRLGVAITPAAEQALLKALAVNASQRFQTMGEFQQALLGNAAVTMGFQPAPALFQPAPEPSYPPGATPVSAPPQPSVYSPPAAPPSHYPQAPRRSANPAAIAAGIGAGVLGLALLVVLIWRLTSGPSPTAVVKPPAGGGQKTDTFTSGPPLVQDPTPPLKEPPPQPEPVKTRFTKAKDGVITDSATGLEWYAGPDRNTDWNQAKGWVESLKAAGGGWRTPTMPELKTLYQPGAGRNNLGLDPIFQTTGFWVWSVQKDASSAWAFFFLYGQESWRVLGFAGSGRAFAVRSSQNSDVRAQEEVVRNPDTPKSVPALAQVPAPSSSLSYVVGGIFSITGPASYLGEPERNSMEMVAQEINAKGGINGHPLKLVIYDDEGDVTKARLHADTLLQKDKALAIVGPSLTHTSMAVLEITQKAKMPLISCAAGSAITSPAQDRFWVFKMAQTDQMAVGCIYQYLQKKNLKKVAILTISTGFGISGKQQLLELAPKYGIQVVAQEVFGEKDSDMTPQLSRLRDAPAQAVICWGTGPAPAIVAKNMKQMGLSIPLIQSHGAASKKFIEWAGYAGEGIIMPVGKLVIWQQLPDNDPQKAMCKEYAEKYQSKFKMPESSFGGYSYDAIRMLNQALSKVGNNRDKIRNELEGTRNFVGISGIFNMSPEDHHGLSPAAFVMVKIHNGRFQLIDQ